MKNRKVFMTAAAAVAAGFVGVWGTLLFQRVMRLREPRVPLSDTSSLSIHLSSKTGEAGRVRFGVATMLTPEATYTTYHRIVAEVCRRTGVPFLFVVRPSYAALRQALERSEVDVAFVCTGTYLRADKKRVRLLVRPEYAPGWEYRALVLVQPSSPFHRIEDLAGCVIAFSDPESLTGCLAPSALIVPAGVTPQAYFRKIVFTGSHDRSILAVSRRVTDAASVDALVWKALVRKQPALAAQLRILWRSPEFGEPPVLVSVRLGPDIVNRLRASLLSLNADATGREILAEIGVIRFVAASPDRYKSLQSLRYKRKTVDKSSRL